MLSDLLTGPQWKILFGGAHESIRLLDKSADRSYQMQWLNKQIEVWKLQWDTRKFLRKDLQGEAILQRKCVRVYNIKNSLLQSKLCTPFSRCHMGITIQFEQIPQNPYLLCVQKMIGPFQKVRKQAKAGLYPGNSRHILISSSFDVLSYYT